MNITPAGLDHQAVASHLLPPQPPSQITTGHRLPSVRTLLLCLVMGCMLPGIGGGMFLFVQNIQEGRQQLEQSSIQTARTLGLALDQQFAQVETTAVMLSQDQALQSNNLALFHNHAMAALARVQLGGNVVVSDTHGQQVLNTRASVGTALPQYGNQPQLQQVLATGKPVISDVFVGGLSKKPTVTVAVPVLHGQKVVYVLSLSCNPERINALLRQQNLPKDWIVVALDRKAKIAARSQNLEEFAGQTSTLAQLKAFEEQSEGTVELVSKEGTPTLAAFSTAPHSRWRVGIGIPRAGLESALMRRAALLGSGLLLLLGLGIALALWVGRRVASSVTGLTLPARDLVAGKPISVPTVYFREAREVALAMADTAQNLVLKTREAQTAMQNLHAAKQALQDLNLNLEAQIKERTQALDDLYNQAPCGYHSLDAEGHITNINQTALDLLGYRREEVIGRLPTMFFDAENAAKFAQNFPQLMRDGHMDNVEREVLCKDGSRVQVLISSKRFFDAQGQVLGSRATLTDNSVNKARQQQVSDLNQFLQEVVEVLPFGVLVLDNKRQVTLRNTLFGTLLDLPVELTQKVPFLFADMVRFNHARGDYPDQSFESALGSFVQMMDSRQTVCFERQQSNGVFLEVQGQPIANDWILLTYTDISTHKLAEQKLNTALAAAESATAAKTQFLSTVSHELRSPLHTMLGHLGILRKAHAQTLDPHLQVAEKSGAQLLWLIDDLLDFNTDAMRPDALQPDWMALAYQRETLLNFGNIAAAKADNRFTMAIAPEVPAQLLVDERRLLQVLQNLVGNATKYTQQGHISLRIERLPKGVEREGVLLQTIRFSVQDSGRGIAEHDLQHIFEPLYRSASALDQPGIGLGLAIARQWVRNMGGEIAVSSALGRGSTFHFDLALEGSDVALGDAGVARSVRSERAVQYTATLRAPPASALPQVDAAIKMGRLLRVVDWAHALASDARYTATALQVIELAEAADLPALHRLLALWQRQTAQTAQSS